MTWQDAVKKKYAKKVELRVSEEVFTWLQEKEKELGPTTVTRIVLAIVEAEMKKDLAAKDTK